MIPHIPEHLERPDSAAREQNKAELAAAYARLFLGSDDGKRVLADMRKKWGVKRLVFVPGEHGRFDTLGAAMREGERHVMLEIEEALALGAPKQALSESQ